jgi:ribosomal protein S18 acetylase RimI-like enzyme
VKRPRPDGSDLRPITQADVPGVADLLARAFADNPGMSWVFRDAATRPDRLRNLFGLLLRRVWLPRGECLTTTSLDGAALWLGPGRWHLPVSVQAGLLPRAAGVAGRETPRMLRGMVITESKHPATPEHWYLAVLGVDPASQGQGFGPHLMTPVLNRCDQEGTPAYLETDTQQNVALYERHGFRVTEQLTLPGGAEPTVWLMWRDPQS